MSSWICNGKTHDPKYSGTGEVHSPYENHSSDCELCGLPKEAVISKVSNTTKYPSLFNLKIVGAITLIFIAGGGVFVSNLFKGDRHTKTYRQAIASGEQALLIVRNHSSYAELEQAQSHLALAIIQLNKIPADASIYTDANQKLNSYDSLSWEIRNKLNNFDLCGIKPQPDSCIF